MEVNESKIDNILDKLHNLQMVINACPLSLEDDGKLRSVVEELEHLVFELKEEK